ncbi:hypothetical protein SNEBB_006258 [Seison nebaliae]|nr:hypothetical protein SNEBB_006258 [Seison nebaliae]
MKILGNVALIVSLLLIVGGDYFQPSVAAAGWFRVVRKAMRPTCMGCAGICERKVRGRCRCVVDRNCLKRMRG